MNVLFVSKVNACVARLPCRPKKLIIVAYRVAVEHTKNFLLSLLMVVSVEAFWLWFSVKQGALVTMASS